MGSMQSELWQPENEEKEVRLSLIRSDGPMPHSQLSSIERMAATDRRKATPPSYRTGSQKTLQADGARSECQEPL